MAQLSDSGQLTSSISPKGKSKMFGSTLTEEEKAAKKARKERERAERRRQDEARRVAATEARERRFSEMPIFVVRETREVRVKASDMQDAIALASAAFKEGQDNDHGIKWGKPFGVEGDTIDRIKVVNVKAVEED